MGFWRLFSNFFETFFRLSGARARETFSRLFRDFFETFSRLFRDFFETFSRLFRDFALRDSFSQVHGTSTLGATFLAIFNSCDPNEICCDPNPQRNLLRTESPAIKAQRAKTLANRKWELRIQFARSKLSRGNQSIFLHRSGPLLKNGLDRPKNRYDRYGFPSFSSISISTVGMDGARVCL